jgi:hypothetical protein
MEDMAAVDAIVKNINFKSFPSVSLAIQQLSQSAISLDIRDLLRVYNHLLSLIPETDEFLHLTTRLKPDFGVQPPNTVPSRLIQIFQFHHPIIEPLLKQHRSVHIPFDIMRNAMLQRDPPASEEDIERVRLSVHKTRIRIFEIATDQMDKMMDHFNMVLSPPRSSRQRRRDAKNGIPQVPFFILDNDDPILSPVETIDQSEEAESEEEFWTRSTNSDDESTEANEETRQLLESQLTVTDSLQEKCKQQIAEYNDHSNYFFNKIRPHTIKPKHSHHETNNPEPSSDPSFFICHTGHKRYRYTDSTFFLRLTHQHHHRKYSPTELHLNKREMDTLCKIHIGTRAGGPNVSWKSLLRLIYALGGTVRQASGSACTMFVPTRQATPIRVDRPHPSTRLGEYGMYNVQTVLFKKFGIDMKKFEVSES